MATLDFREFHEDYVVVHFGGRVGNLDIYTFAQALIAFGDTAKAINAVVNPGQDIELFIEADGEGSYRAKVRKKPKGEKGFFSDGVKSVFWGLVATAIWETLFAPALKGPDVQITTTPTEVVVQHGNDRVIIPRAVHEALPNIENDPEVQRGIWRMFSIVKSDAGVTDFGLTADLSDLKPNFSVPRNQFENLETPIAVLVADTQPRVREVNARLVILKAWINHTKRKWSFEWNGVPISAPIKDEAFLNGLDQRKYLIGAGDALDVIMTFKQRYDGDINTYVNDQNSFVVSKVNQHVARAPAPRLFAERSGRVRPVRRIKL